MDIYHYLKNDHKKVSNLFKKIISASSSARRKNLYLALKNELTLHADTEKATFYAALKKYASSQDEVRHGDEEHREIKSAIKKLDLLAPRTRQWLVQLGELKRTVEHHVEDEENEMFKAAKKVLSQKQANTLAVEMDRLKKKKTGEIKKDQARKPLKKRIIENLKRMF